MQRSKVISSYLNLLRTTNKVFKNDIKTLAHVQNLARVGYREKINETNDTEITNMVDHANAVASFLKNDLIQAVRKNDNVIELKPDEKTKSYQLYEFVNDQPAQRKKRGKVEINEPSGGCCGGGCGKTPSIGAKSECS